MATTDVEVAKSQDPEGTYCASCGTTNDFADDCGWFYMPKPVCKKCWDEAGRTTAER